MIQMEVLSQAASKAKGLVIRIPTQPKKRSKKGGSGARMAMIWAMNGRNASILRLYMSRNCWNSGDVCPPKERN